MPGARERPQLYADTAIECALVVKAVFHLGVDEKSKDIVAVDLPTSGVHDSPHMPEVLHLVDDDVRQVSGDRAYDTGACYQAILARGAIPTIPPRRNARLSTAKDPPPYRAERDAVIQRI